jgi:hypothetical protein
VHEITRNDTCLRRIHPFMMIWPPTFPALKDDPSRFVFWPLSNITLVFFLSYHKRRAGNIYNIDVARVNEGARCAWVHGRQA